MASNIQSNPVYYSLASLSSKQHPGARTVVLHKRADHSGFGVYIGEDVPSGLYIVTVERNSPASDANIQPGDRVLAINGQAVSSMSTNPKDALIKAASNTQSLSLTIQSTNIFQTLGVPLGNTTQDNDTRQKPKRPSSVRTMNPNTDLENYIKSLFANEDIQILPASNHNEFILKSDSRPKSAVNAESRPFEFRYSSDRKKQHRSHHHHHHRHHRQPKQALLQTQETQTSTNEDFDENIPQEQQLEQSSSRQHSAHPSMGKSQLILRAQQQNPTDNVVRQSQPFASSTNDDELNFMPVPPSPIMDNAPPPKINQTVPPAQTAAVPSTAPNRVNLNSNKNEANISHMADAVTAAMAAARKPDQSDGREQVVPMNRGPATPPPSREQVPSNRQANVAPPSREQTTSVEQRSRVPPSREQVPSAREESIVPPPNRPIENSPRESVPKRINEPSKTQNAPPPPYTPTENRRESSRLVDTRSSVGQNQSATPSNRPDSLREVRLHRAPEFQGFGFHLQYNKVYYLVQRIEAGSPAVTGGLQANDVILSINQQSTNSMEHVKFVEIVNSSTNVTFLVQTLEDYLRTNPQRVRGQRTTPSLAAAPSNEAEKPKSGLSKALNKLTSR